MYWVTTAALFAFGFSLAFIAVKILFELPSWLVRSALYVIVTAIYVIALMSSREAGFGWFHLFWSIILMMLIFGLLRKQDSHVCRWSLFIAGSCLASLLLYSVAAAIHRQTDIWLHRAYINRRQTGFPELILLGFPFGVMIGLLFAWIGTKKDRTTGHAIAAHWSWWCVPSNVALLFVVVGCLLLNDRAICTKRDAIIARARELRERVDGLTSKFNIEGGPTDLDHVDVVAAADGQYSKLRKLTPDHVVALAGSLLRRAKRHSSSDDVPTAIGIVAAATNAIDQGVSANGPGSTDFARFERERLEVIDKLVAKCDVQHAPLFAKLVTERPYSNLEPPLPLNLAGFQFEQSKLNACSLALRSFTNDPYVVPPRGQRLSFWWRFLGLRHGIATAEPELNFTLPPDPATLPYSYAEPQLARVLANAAVRGAIVTLNEHRVPEHDEMFVGELSAEESSSVEFVQQGATWALFSITASSVDDSARPSLHLHDAVELIRTKQAIGFSFKLDPLFRYLQSEPKRKEFRTLFKKMIPFAGTESALVRVTQETFDELLAASGRTEIESKLKLILQDPGSRVLDLSDSWVDIGLCFISPNAGVDDGAVLPLPVDRLHEGFGFLATMSAEHEYLAFKSLLELTDDDLHARREAAMPGVRDYLLRPGHTFRDLKAAADKLRNFYFPKGRRDMRVLFCPNPPLGDPSDSAPASDAHQ